MIWDPLLLEEDDPAGSAAWHPFEILVSRRGRVVELAVRGELDLATSDLLLDRTLEAHEPGVAEVRIDLAGVTFADASAVVSLLRCRDLARDRGALLRLVHPSQAAALVLDLTGVGTDLARMDGNGKTA